MSRKMCLLAVAAPFAVAAGFVVSEIVWASCSDPHGQIQFDSTAGSEHCLGVEQSSDGLWYNQFTLHHDNSNTIIVQRDTNYTENQAGVFFRKSTSDNWVSLTSGGTQFTATADTNVTYFFYSSLSVQNEDGSVGVKVTPVGENARAFSWMTFADE